MTEALQSKNESATKSSHTHSNTSARPPRPPTHTPWHTSPPPAQVEDLQQLLAEREGEVAEYEAKLRTGLSEAQAATADELRAQLAAERQRNSDQAQVVRRRPSHSL